MKQAELPWGPIEWLQPVSLLLKATLRCLSKPDLEPRGIGFRCPQKYPPGHRGPARPGDWHIRGCLKLAVTAPLSAPRAIECVAETAHLY